MNASIPSTTNVNTATRGRAVVAAMAVRAITVFGTCKDIVKNFVRDHAFISETEHKKNSGLMMAIRTGG